MFYQELFAEALQEPCLAIGYLVSRHLAASFPDRARLEGSDYDFNKLHAFAKAGHCRLRLEESMHHQINVWWSDETGIEELPRNAWFEVSWQGHDLDVVLLTWTENCIPYHWILGDSDEVVRGFYAAVCGYKPEIQGELLIYEGGRWSASGRMLRQIGGATLDNLVLPEGLKEEIVGDVQRFFDGRSTYEKYKLPWKRGLLFLGPPGNGKTHAIKAIVNATEKPCLYVKSFESDDFCAETGIRGVFARARRASPCLLVLEDLDAMITDENRSFFLNELDGFAANAGILTIATTNHPAKLDAAILDRPSRFDRKYHFRLPGSNERRAYVEQWNATLEPELQLSPEGITAAAVATEGFSFAYLKELLLSSLLAWVAAPEKSTMDAVLAEQTGTLLEQMKSTKEARNDPAS
jgi:hypothetical protein